ncbi:MAG: hypothetical protein KA761_08365 [Gemmatimonadaceae bacterium]|nr:hypothetical protein [Gemmatimonadaceae bacterium]
MSPRTLRSTALTTGLAILMAVATTADAQQFLLTPSLASLTHSEIGEDLEFSGVGGGLVASYRTGRFGVAGEGILGSLASGDQAVTASSYRVALFDLRATYRVLPGLDAVLGAQSRSISPEFAAQDVGLIRIGLATETALSRLADIGVRGAWLPYADFNGGGEAGFGFEVGLGVSVGPADGRYRALMSYDFQRIDRTVNGADVPMQMMVARLGLQVGF